MEIGRFKIYFRIPFTGYFVGRVLLDESYDMAYGGTIQYLSPLFFFRKEWNGKEYEFVKV